MRIDSDICRPPRSCSRFPRDAVRHDLLGTGFVVPRSEGLNITAGAWISSKWPQRAPEGHALLRAFLGGARDPDVLAKSDGELDGDRAARAERRFWASAARPTSAACIDGTGRARSWKWATSDVMATDRCAARRVILACSCRPPVSAASAFPIASPTRAQRRPVPAADYPCAPDRESHLQSADVIISRSVLE